MSILKSLTQFSLNWLLPNRCVLCLQHSSNILCANCQTHLPQQQHACIICANPLTISQQICGRCLVKPPYYDNTHSLFSYKDPVDRFILDLKFHNQLKYAKMLGDLFADYLINHYSQTRPDVIIPMPLHRARLRERGFNQALELAKPIAKRLNIPIMTTACQRIRNTKAQSFVNPGERKKNVNGAFSIKKNFQANHVAIIDDVVTTASTVNALSKTLKSHINKIDIWCLARTYTQRLA